MTDSVIRLNGGMWQEEGFYLCVLSEAETQTYLISFMTRFKSYVSTADILTTLSGEDCF